MVKPLFLFAHGAGASSNHPWMLDWTERLNQIGVCHPFDYPYMAAGKRAPDRLPKLIEAHRGELQEARKGHRGPVFLIGKSMGGRLGCHLALEEPVDGVICLGYPLQGMGKNPTLRDQVLLDLRVPILFVQGTRDNLCPLDVLDGVRKNMTAPHVLHVVETGNHSLETTKRHLKEHGTSQDAVTQRIASVVSKFVS